MNFNQWLQNLKVKVEPFAEIGYKNALQFRIEKGQSTIGLTECVLDSLSDDAHRKLQYFADKGFMDKFEFFLTTEVFGKGPKVFKPTAEQLFALERMELNVELQDFHTPFTTMVVELPPEYIATIKDVEDKPHLAWLYKKDNVFAHSVLFSQVSLKSFWCAFTPDTLIEEWMTHDYDGSTFSEHPTSSSEYDLENRIRRAVLNYCLLLDEVGVKKDCPCTPNQYNQLVKWCQKKTKHTEKNKIQLVAQAFNYSLKKEVELVRCVEVREAEGQEGGETKEVGFHYRRGHYRMQPHGPKNLLRKRIRIPGTMVNKHLFINPQTQSYKT